MTTLDDLARRAIGLARGSRRVILGITGPPGAGKTTLTEALLKRVADLPVDDAAAGQPWVAHLPMDGFHLADVQLERLGLSHCKGAPETFDSAGYLATLQRVAQADEQTVYAPGFERVLEQPIAAAIAIPPSARLIITEGNYLLLGDPPWFQLRQILTEIWYVDVPDSLRRERLVQRHIQFGKTEQHAKAWVEQSDERNADRVRQTIARADLVVDWNS